MQADYQACKTVGDFMADCEAGRLDPISRRSLSPATKAKARTAYRDLIRLTQPASWDATRDGEWSGPLMRDVTTDLLQSVAINQLSLTSAGYVRGGWLSALMAMCAHAHRVGAIPSPVLRPHVQPAGIWARAIPTHLIGAYLTACLDDAELFVGTLLSLAIGARSEDVWSLRCGQLVGDTLPRVRLVGQRVERSSEFEYVHQIEFTSRKRSKLQLIPLCHAVAACVRRWLNRSGSADPDSLMFPTYGNAPSAWAKCSKKTRRRNAEQKLRLESIGLDTSPPPRGSDRKSRPLPRTSQGFWQPGRSARGYAIESLEAVLTKTGAFVAGHAQSDVTNTNYCQPDDRVRAAIFAVEWPDVVREFGGDTSPLKARS
jgi:hypothetical protein